MTKGPVQLNTGLSGPPAERDNVILPQPSTASDIGSLTIPRAELDPRIIRILVPSKKIDLLSAAVNYESSDDQLAAINEISSYDIEELGRSPIQDSRLKTAFLGAMLSGNAEVQLAVMNKIPESWPAQGCLVKDILAAGMRSKDAAVGCYQQNTYL